MNYPHVFDYDSNYFWVSQIKKHTDGASESSKLSKVFWFLKENGVQMKASY